MGLSTSVYLMTPVLHVQKPLFGNCCRLYIYQNFFLRITSFLRAEKLKEKIESHLRQTANADLHHVTKLLFTVHVFHTKISKFTPFLYIRIVQNFFIAYLLF